MRKFEKEKKKKLPTHNIRIICLVFQCFSRSMIEEAKEQYTRTHSDNALMADFFTIGLREKVI